MAENPGTLHTVSLSGNEIFFPKLMDLDIAFCFDRARQEVKKRPLRITLAAKEEVVSVNEQKRKRETFTFPVCQGVDA